jgi:tetratricopeptide (TPR) repeat protein
VVPDRAIFEVMEISSRDQPPPRWTTWLSAGIVVLAAVAAYHNSFSGAFVFDDQNWIVDNPTIRRLWPLGPWLCPPPALVVGGRPVVSLTLALNYAWGGTHVWGYHAVNLAIHILAALALLGLLRRTLRLPGLRERFGPAATPLALAITLVWTVHPLQTMAVTYVIQRAESLLGLFYLLTLYGLVRGATSARRTLWYLVAAAACWLGMATKEVMVTAPVVALLYDRTFLSGSFREAVKQRWVFYLALAASWGVLAWAFVSTGCQGNTAGFAIKQFTWWTYLCTQPGVIVHYLRLAFWPAGLCLDYGWPAARSIGEILPPAIVVVGLFALTLWALVKRPTLGFLGAWFYLILAPTSSFVPIRDAAFEQRMYLPLAAVATLAILAGCTLWNRLFPASGQNWVPCPPLPVALLALVVVALGWITVRRNVDFQSKVAIWADTVAKAPANSRAHYNLGQALGDVGRFDEAVAQYQEALRIQPDYADAHNNLGMIWAGRGQILQAIGEYRKALDASPQHAQAHNNLANALESQGEADEALTHYQQAVESRPDFAEAHYHLGNAWSARGEVDRAIAEYGKALAIRPDLAEAHNNLGLALADRRDLAAAIAQYEQALRLKPDHAAAHYNLAGALAGRGELDQAVAHYQQAVKIQPRFAEAHFNLGSIFYQQGRTAAALAQWREGLRWKPDVAAVLSLIAWIEATSPQAALRNGSDAVELARRAVRLSGGQDPVSLDALAAAYAETGRFAEAIDTARQALRQASIRHDAALAGAVGARIQYYQAGAAYRESR